MMSCVRISTWVRVSCRLLLVAHLIFISSQSIESTREWQILTDQNFSDQIRTHPFVLLMVTVQWSGESRSLMKVLAHKVFHNQEKFGSLRLMLLYRNNEKMLADSIGAMDEITILYYCNSMSYKYQGRLQAQNILSSAQYIMSLLPEELPLKPLRTPEDIDNFLKPTDKTITLFEFCGWTPILLAKTNNISKNVFDAKGGLFMTDSNGETNKTLSLKEKKTQKEMVNKNMMCGIRNDFNGNWLGGFSFVNKTPDVLSCTFEQFRQFEAFFSKFTNTVREFYLPPEKHRFGLVSDRSLLSFMGIEDSSSWFALLQFVGCPNCSKILKEGDELEHALQMHTSFVAEIEGEGHNLKPALPKNRPSVLLFVDRSSDSSEIRRKSYEALDVFRKFVLHNQSPYHINMQNHDRPETSSSQAYQVSTSNYGYHQLKEVQGAQNIIIKDKVSIKIVNDDGQRVALDNIASNLQGNSLSEILTHVLRREKGTKLSSVAKQAGFQLLSEDFHIKMTDTILSETEDSQSSQVVPEYPSENLASQAEVTQSISPATHEKQSESTYMKYSSPYNKEKEASVDTIEEVSSLEDDELYFINEAFSVSENVKVEPKISSEVDKLDEPKLLHQTFKGSFFFCDGSYQLLRSLTTEAKVPSVVLIEPSSEQHYVFPEHEVFSYLSLGDFIDGVLNDSLIPYQRSKYFILSPKESSKPPFVNLDFHEVDSIPQVTADTFSTMVLGSNLSDTSNTDDALKKDVVVLFSNSWCGFCQRMEIVVREVYRALKGYISLLKYGSGNSESLLKNDNFGRILLKVPLIYLMDCTLNDCSLILKSAGQRERYPSLLLFPSERKKAVSYEGDMTTASILKFIDEHGSDSHLIRETGLLRTKPQARGNNNKRYKNAPSAVHEDSPPIKDKPPEVELNVNDRLKTEANSENNMQKDYHMPSPSVVVGSILLATEKLNGAQLFENTKILIVSANESTGFRGLIYNKHINWESLDQVGLKFLKQAPLSLGGPVIIHGMPLVSLVRKDLKHQYPEVLPGVHFLDEKSTLNEIERLRSGKNSSRDYWFFLGFSGWTWDQLFEEISEGAWSIINDKGWDSEVFMQFASM